jgi:hypothetical protein
LFPNHRATSLPWVDAGQDRSFLYPFSALAPPFRAPCLALSNRMHTRARVRDADAMRGTALPSRLRRPRLHPCRDCVAVLLALAVVAKPPACLRAQVRTWTPPLAGQCSLTNAKAKASHFCCQTSCELKPSSPTFSSSLDKPVSDLDLLFARRHPRRVVRCLCQPSPRRAALFRLRHSAHAHLHPRESSPALPVQTVHAHVHAHARPRKRAATPPRTPQSRRRGAQAAPSRLPSRRRARPGASSHACTLVHALDQAVSFALLVRVR